MFIKIIENKNLRPIDIWILNQLIDTIKFVGKNFENEYNFHLIVKRLREFYYSDYCDFYLESTKPLLKSNNHVMQEIVWNILRNINSTILILYHPFIPSITEELWQRINNNNTNINDQKLSILECEYPKYDKISKFDKNIINLNEINDMIQQTKQFINFILNLKQLIQINERPKGKIFIILICLFFIILVDK